MLKEYHGESVDVIIPEGITRIEYGCFRNLDIKSIVFPKSLEIIDDRFDNCKNLKVITVRSNVSGNAYSYSKQFDEVNLVYDNDNSTSKFSSLKFKGKKLYISEGIEIIGGFLDFNEIFLPKTIKKINDCSFCDKKMHNRLEKLNYDCNLNNIDISIYAFYDVDISTGIPKDYILTREMLNIYNDYKRIRDMIYCPNCKQKYEIKIRAVLSSSYLYCPSCKQKHYMDFYDLYDRNKVIAKYDTLKKQVDELRKIYPMFNKHIEEGYHNYL